MGLMDHIQAGVAAVDLEGTDRPLADRSPSLVAGLRSWEIRHCRLRVVWEAESSELRYR